MLNKEIKTKLKEYLGEEVLNEMVTMTAVGEAVEGFVVNVYSNDHNPPHVHFINGKIEYKVAITEEEPSCYEDIRFIEVYRDISIKFKKAIFEWLISKPVKKLIRIKFKNNWEHCYYQLYDFNQENFLSINDENLYKC